MILQRNHGYKYRQVCFEELAYVIVEANSSEMYKSGRPAAWRLREQLITAAGV